MTKAIGLIPARAGSKRIKNKNIRMLGDHPLLAYSIKSAIDSGVFDSVVCATDSEDYAEIARYYGAEVPVLRSTTISGDTSPDIEWVEWILDILSKRNQLYDVFSILRPTSPFRKPDTIRRAMSEFLSLPGIDSLRAVEKCSQHPGKMWILRGKSMIPLIPLTPAELPWHSRQYAGLPEVYVQNASLEIAWTRVVKEEHSIAGHVLAPFLTTEEEGLDVNQEFDWWKAEHLLELGMATLPEISIEPFKRNLL
jgi:CMP-N,N'-diacetyllegionaminic acid synthase